VLFLNFLLFKDQTMHVKKKAGLTCFLYL